MNLQIQKIKDAIKLQEQLINLHRKSDSYKKKEDREKATESNRYHRNLNIRRCIYNIRVFRKRLEILEQSKEHIERLGI